MIGGASGALNLMVVRLVFSRLLDLSGKLQDC